MEEGFSRPVFRPKTGHFLRAVSGDPSWVVERIGFLQKIRSIHSPKLNRFPQNPSKIEWDLTNGPLSKLLAARAIRYSGLGVHSMGPVGSFLD